jgi:hypothetical protein
MPEGPAREDRLTLIVTALATVMRAFEAVICAEIAPMDVDECGARHHVQARVLSITQPIETGTVCTPGETAVLAVVARAAGAAG